MGFACALTLIACGSPTPARPDGNEDAHVDAKATAADDASMDHGHSDASSPERTSASSPDVNATDESVADRGLDDPLVDSRDGQSAQDGTSCVTLANTSSPVAPTLVTSISRNAMGGALTDGIYELAEAEETISSAPAKFWRTFQISDSGTTFNWIIQDIGLPPDHHFAGTLQIMGTSLVMTDQCAGMTLTYPYDAQGVGLTLYFLFGGPTSGRVFHYRAHAAP